MTRADIVNLISEEVNLSKNDIEKIVVKFQKTIVQKIAEGETIYLRGFGTFGSKIRKERMARNIKTNEPILVPLHKAPYFKAGKELKEIKNQSKVNQ